MTRRKVEELKDKERLVIQQSISSNKKKIDALVEAYGNKLLGRQNDSTSVAAFSGGRPESNRRKF